MGKSGKQRRRARVERRPGVPRRRIDRARKKNGGNADSSAADPRDLRPRFSYSNARTGAINSGSFVPARRCPPIVRRDEPHEPMFVRRSLVKRAF